MAKVACLSAGLLFSALLAVVPAAAAVDCKADPANAACHATKAVPTSPKPPTASQAEPAKSQAAAKGSVPKPLVEPHAVGNAQKAGSSSGKKAAKPAPATRPTTTAARRPAPGSRSLARRGGHREGGPMREAQDGFAPPYPEYRPHGGLLHDWPPGALPPACDEVCQYRDWLNRYAAWYRDFGRYYYGAGALAGRPGAPPASLGSNNPPALAAPMQSDQSERDRMDPWHGYNRHNGLGNGY